MKKESKDEGVKILKMSLEEIEKRYVKGYDYTDREHRNQLYNDMEWLMDEVLKLQDKYKNLINAINEVMEINNKL